MPEAPLRRPLLTVALALAAAVAAWPAPKPPGASAPKSRAVNAPKPHAGIAIGDVTWTDREVLRAVPPDKRTWHRVAAGDKLRTGDTLRTGEGAIARVELPWMAVTLGPSTMFTVPATTVLSTVLEQGRAEFAGAGRDIVKIQVGEGEVRGGGRLVLRRSVGLSSASVLEGVFRVRSLGRTVEVKAGQGTVVMDGRPPLPSSPLPAAPVDLRPGGDPVYVKAGRSIELRWAAAGASHYVELFGLRGDAVVMARETAAPPLRLEIPWLGTYRWRVSARDARWIESRPSAQGLICVVER